MSGRQSTPHGQQWPDVTEILSALKSFLPQTHGHHWLVQRDGPFRIAIQVIEGVPRIQGFDQKFAAAGVRCAGFVVGLPGPMAFGTGGVPHFTADGTVTRRHELSMAWPAWAPGVVRRTGSGVGSRSWLAQDVF